MTYYDKGLNWQLLEDESLWIRDKLLYWPDQVSLFRNNQSNKIVACCQCLSSAMETLVKRIHLEFPSSAPIIYREACRELLHILRGVCKD